MKKILIFLLLFTFCFANVYVDNSIDELFEENDNVNVIVMFKQEDSKAMRISSDSQEIGMKIQNVISKTSIENEKVRELNIINGFSTEITQEDLEELKNNPNVEGIYYNYPVHIFLDDSVPLINATSVWPIQYNSKNITGQGQTVCVIDTGVDYTHPNLGGCTTQEFLDGNCEKVIGGYDFYNNDNNPIDDHGHGTHCAGIIASTHPTYMGVAPDSKIVAIKALDSNGTGYFSGVISGIEWCVDNKDIYNISVISMSLGDDSVNGNYCNDIFLASYINSAILENISVVIATGNNANSTYNASYNYDYISGPACVENSIRVTATTKGDLFASYANRGGTFDDIIAAPGSSIISTYINDNLASSSGTSMATPHVAGVIALYNQYHYDRYGRYVSPSEIKQMLNDTGVVLYDSLSGKNYSRVDVYELFDSINLDILGTSSINSFYNNSNSIYFEINLSQSVSNVYVNITLPNQTNEIIHLINFTSKDYNGTYTIPNLHGVYSFVYVINDSGFIDYSENYNFTVLYDYICVNFTDCNSSLFEYEKVLLNNSIELNSSEYFIFNNNTEFNCNYNEIYNSSYFEIIGDNSSLNNCIFYGGEFNFNSTYNFTLFNVHFMNYSEIYFNHSILNIGNNSILLNEKVIANSINTTANYKINMSCDNLEIDILHVNKITNSTLDFVFSDYFTSCFNDTIEFNSSLNGSYTYNIFNISVTNTTGGRTNTIYNYTYLFNVTNNNIFNDVFTFNQSNNTQLFDLNSTNNILIEFNVSRNVSGNYTLNYSICSDKIDRCLNSNFTIEVLDVPSFNSVQLNPYAVSNNSNVTFNLNVSNYDSIWFNLTLPNNSNFIDFYHNGYNYTTNQTGIHNITFYVNDTFNYIINYDDYFEVFELEESNLTFTGSEGNLTNITFKMFYRNQTLFSQLLSNNSIDIYDLLYDLEINFSKLKLKLNDVNLTSKEFNLIFDEIDYEDYLLTNIINNTFNFSGNYTLEFNYSELNYTNENYLELYKCSDWNFTNNTCNGIFEKKFFLLNNISKTIIYSDNSFSAFSILQSLYCGDGVCNGDETCSTCSGDCGSCYVPPTGGSTGGSTGGYTGSGLGGGGGGGTGGGSAILPKDAVYKNITMDIYDYDLVENEEYKLFYVEMNDSVKYLFYSKYYGEVCFNNNCTSIKPFEYIEFISNKTTEINFEKIQLDKAQLLNKTIYETNYTLVELKKDILFYLDEFNSSRENEDKCAFFLGYHISPCVDKQSCLLACRSIPLCSGLSNSDIFLDYSKFIYLNVQDLNQEIQNCYSIINSTDDVGEYEQCVSRIYNVSKTIESSPVFGTCPTCLGVCDDVNYSYISLNEIISLIGDYEKQFVFEVVDVNEYNVKSNELNSLLDKVIEVNKTISYSNREFLEMIYLHNNFEEVEYKEKENQLNEILFNINLYYEMNCTSDYERFLNLNHFNSELDNCLIDDEISSTEIDGCADCGEPDFTFIILTSLVIIGLFLLYKKLKIMRICR